VSERRTLWALRALALALALLAWTFVSLEREQQGERVIPVTVQYNNPRPEDIIVLEPTETVNVRLRGAVSRISRLNPLQLSVVVDLPAEARGLLEYPLTAGDVARPTDLEVLSIEPNVLFLELDRMVNEMKPIVPRLEGEPAAGAVAGTPTVLPPNALVRGPASRMRQIESLSTRPVDLRGHAIEFEERVVVVSPDPLVKVVESAVVTVRIPLSIPNAPESGLDEGTAQAESSW
jgi:YbbR domain-containing protein